MENQIRNVYSGRIPCYSRKLHPIDKTENGMVLKSHRFLIQIATQNKILSHKLEIESYSSLKVLAFLSFQMAHVTAQTTHTQRDFVDFFHVVPEAQPTKSKSYLVVLCLFKTHWTFSPIRTEQAHILGTNDEWIHYLLCTSHTGLEISIGTVSYARGHHKYLSFPS